MERLSKKLLIFAPSTLSRGCDIEESYRALNRQRTWKILEYGREVEGCSSCSCIYTAFPTMGIAYVNTSRCELISVLAYSGIPGPSDREC